MERVFKVWEYDIKIKYKIDTHPKVYVGGDLDIGIINFIGESSGASYWQYGLVSDAGAVIPDDRFGEIVADRRTR